MAHVFLQQWQFPSGVHTNSLKVFSAKRSADGKFRAGSSDCFAIYPILRAWAQLSIPAGSLVAEIRSLLALCTVVDGFHALRAGLFSAAETADLDAH